MTVLWLLIGQAEIWLLIGQAELWLLIGQERCEEADGGLAPHTAAAPAHVQQHPHPESRPGERRLISGSVQFKCTLTCTIQNKRNMTGSVHTEQEVNNWLCTVQVYTHLEASEAASVSRNLRSLS